MAMTLEEYLALQYPLEVVAEREGGYTVRFPDLPGCVSRVEDLADVGAVAEEIRRGWLTIAFEEGEPIPLPSYPEEFSGKFVVRLPRSLHRELAVSAAREGVSLNQYVVALLARHDAVATIERRLDELCCEVAATNERSRYSFNGMPGDHGRLEPSDSPE